jgi:hypothetical protein
MTQDEIIEMARQAGLHFYNFVWTSPTDTCMYPEGVYQEALEAFAKLVREDEREACAIVCDDINAKYKWPDDVAERVASQWCADAIRARGQA